MKYLRKFEIKNNKYVYSKDFGISIQEIYNTMKKLDENKIPYKLLYFQRNNKKFFFKICSNNSNITEKSKEILEKLGFYIQDDHFFYKWSEYPKNVDIETFINANKYNL